MSDKVRVELGPRSYDIHVGPGLIADAGRYLTSVAGRSKLIVISDETVAMHHLESFRAGIAASGLDHAAIVLPPGEATKNFAQLGELVEAILDHRPERGSMVVALGGGVIGDIAGLAAALVMRGIGFAQIPTTLLSQVDSAVGGKTAVNTPHGKNLVGAFYQPRIVLCDTTALDTLPRRELLAGYAEVVKYGLINDAAFFDWLEANGEKVIAGAGDARIHAVTKSCAAKAAIVTEDETERGARALLNLGHTFGHALEGIAQYDGAVLHGEGIAVGLTLAFDLSVALGLCPAQDAARVRAHLAAVGLPTTIAELGCEPDGPDQLIDYMRRDKKVRDGKLTFILARGIGKSFITGDVETDAVRALLSEAVAA